ncbi:hypothetical protein MO867_13520 [Microbulbifer sp. OS29]|uniref:Uncharacterized protein n=1 Tax=Microbulbifer okhotskensis TaxID=2926617 RepID=A0A9X2J5A3_9GAMM|nr:hypothetical protein [Microbulbifer okhotskensis]MCO1335352.1 hypothetical protein [Microbulbifer okhotskensis]
MLDEKFIIGGIATLIFFASWHDPKLYRETLIEWISWTFWLVFGAFCVWAVAMIVVLLQLPSTLEITAMEAAIEAIEKSKIPLLWWVYLLVLGLISSIANEIASRREKNIEEDAS